MTLRPEIPFDVVPCTDGTVNVAPVSQTETVVRMMNNGVVANLTVEQAIYMADRLVDAVTGRVNTHTEKALLDALLGKVKWAR